MAVFRVEKTKDFTIMSNHHLRNTELSLKAKGLLSLMLSLPEDWDYTTKGLAHICKDGVDSITTALKELERHGYLTRQRLRYDNGQWGDIEYTIHEQPVSTENTGLSPKRENPRQVKPEQAKPKQAEPEQENPAQLNTNPLKTKKSKKDKSITYPSIYPAEPEAANRTDGMDRIELIEAYREIIKENIEITKEPEKFTTIKLDADKAIERLAAEKQQFDYLFLDPPYAKQKIIDQIHKMEELGLFSKTAVIVCETDKTVELPESVAGFHQIRKQIYGITAVTIYRKEGNR